MAELQDNSLKFNMQKFSVLHPKSFSYSNITAVDQINITNILSKLRYEIT